MAGQAKRRSSPEQKLADSGATLILDDQGAPVTVSGGKIKHRAPAVCPVCFSASATMQATVSGGFFLYCRTCSCRFNVNRNTSGLQLMGPWQRALRDPATAAILVAALEPFLELK
jgi:hypothetical protein